MPIFTPPLYPAPCLLPRGDPLVGINRLWARYRSGTASGYNVHQYTDGTAEITDTPPVWSVHDGVESAHKTVAYTYQGAHDHVITAAQAAVLTANGFGAYIH